MKYWKQHFPLLRIRRPSRDVCDKCHIYHHRFKRRFERGKDRLDDDDSDSEESSSDEDDTDDDTDENGDAKAIGLMREACLHVEQAASQRKLANEKIEAAVEDEKEDKAHSKRTRCIVMDYSQNAGLPQFGDSQAGPTYYYSLININIFGVVDTSIEGGQLDAFVYHEGQGAKGGNNVASLVMTYLKRKDWLKTYETGKELNILMDNCNQSGFQT